MDAGASYIAKHSSTLRSVSLELWETSEDIWTLMAATFTCCMPQLQLVSIKMSPQWAASVSRAWPLYQSPTFVELHADQLSATKACLHVLGHKAPNLRALSTIDNGSLRTLPPSFSKLRHLVLDCWDPGFGETWVPELPQLETLRVKAPLYRRWLADLRAMTNLAYFSVMQHLPSAVQLPGPCQLHAGDIDFNYQHLHLDELRADMALRLPWLTRLQIAAREMSLIPKLNRKLLDLDLHLDELTLRFHDIGHDRFPIAISATSCAIIRQAKHVSLYAEDIVIHIASDANLAWLRVRIFAEMQLTLKYGDPEVLLKGRSAIMLQFSRTNILNASVVWRPIAKTLGLTISTSMSQHENKVMDTLCLSTGSTEDQRFLQAPCICHACMECLAYYDMLK